MSVSHLHHHGHHQDAGHHDLHSNLHDHHNEHREMVLHARRIYEGDLHTFIALFKGRWTCHIELSDADDKVLFTNIIAENEARPIMDARIFEMPCEFLYMPAVTESPKDDPEAKRAVAFAAKFTEQLNEWARTVPGLGVLGLPLMDSLGTLNEDQEKDGNAAVTMGRFKEGDVWFAIRDSVDIRPKVDPMQPQVAVEIRFEWFQEETEEGSETAKIVKYVETYSKDTYKLERDGEELADRTREGPGFIPVAIAPRRIRKGSVLGDPGTVDIEQGLLNYLWSLYMFNRANKYESFGLYSKGAGNDDDGVKEPKCWVIEPGGYFPEIIQKVGGNINTQTLQAQLQGRLESMRRQGFVREKGSAEADGRSGKAMLIGNELMRKYVKRKLVLIRMLLMRIATYWGRLAGLLEIDQLPPVVVSFPELNTDDADVLQQKADWNLKAVVAEAITVEMFFANAQALGYVAQGRDPSDMAEELASQAEKGAEEAAQRLLAAAEEDENGEEDGER